MNRAHPLHEQAGALQVAGSAVAIDPMATALITQTDTGRRVGDDEPATPAAAPP